jgi:ATP-dependent DNA helicase RecG
VPNETDKSEDERYLDSLIQQKNEHRKLEFKDARNAYSYDRMLDYCCAICNEGGGSLVFGVTDKMPREVVGTRAFTNANDVEFKVLRAINTRVVFREITYAGKRVLILAIPGRPSGTPVATPDGRYLMRSGESLVSMTQDELRRIFDEPKGHVLERLASGSLHPGQVVEILDTDTFFVLTETPVPANIAERMERLETWKLVAEQPDGGWAITNMGALLLARDLSRFEHLRFRQLRILKYSGTSKVNATLDSFEPRGYAAAFAGVLGLLTTLLPVNEEIAQSLRQTVPLYPEVALREFLANAMIHQDFEQEGVQLTIEMYDDRLEITNAGRPLIDVTRFVDDEKSRNSALADIARRMKLCESRGSGIDRVLSALELHQLPAPRFIAGTDSTGVQMIANQRFQDMTLQERAWAAFLHCCLKYVSGSYMDNASLRNRFGLSENKVSSVTAVINTAIEMNLIRRQDGSGQRPEDGRGASRRFARYWPAFA